MSEASLYKPSLLPFRAPTVGIFLGALDLPRGGVHPFLRATPVVGIYGEWTWRIVYGGSSLIRRLPPPRTLHAQPLPSVEPLYRGTSLTRTLPPLVPYRMHIPRVLGGSYGEAVSYGRGTPVHALECSFSSRVRTAVKRVWHM